MRAIERVDELKKQLERAYETNRRLNRRCQEAESRAVQAENRFDAMTNVVKQLANYVKNDHDQLGMHLSQVRRILRDIYPGDSWWRRMFGR